MKIRYTKGLSAIALLLALSIGSTPAAASSLDFVLSDQTVLAGDPVIVDVYLSDPAGITVGTFDLFLNYDPNILTFDSSKLTFGSGLGGPEDSLQYFEELQPGSINVVPIPGSLWLMGFGLLGLLEFRRQRRD